MQDKLERGDPLTKTDLVSLILCSLMGGDMSQKDRIKVAFEITNHAENIPEDDIRKIEVGVYAMADKFLGAMDMEEIKAGIKMTRLGQMLVNDGKLKGRVEGKVEERAEGIIWRSTFLKTGSFLQGFLSVGLLY